MSRTTVLKIAATASVLFGLMVTWSYSQDALVAGCGAGSSTDLTLLGPDRPIARCDAGAPAPMPLPQRVHLTVGTGAMAEFAAPLVLAKALGEFDKEGLDVDIVVLPGPDQITQIAAGSLDAGILGFEPSMYVQFDNGLGIKAVMGHYRTPDADPSQKQQGIWARAQYFADPKHPNPAELNGTTWGQYTPVPNPTVVGLIPGWVDQGLDISSLSWNVVSFTDVALALSNGAIAAASVTTPFWYELADNPDLVLLSPYPAHTTGGTVFGERLLSKEPEVGRAYVRAILRTINTYLGANYKEKSGETVTALAQALGISEEALKRTPPLNFDWEIRGGSFDLFQNGYRLIGAVTRETNVPEGDLVDRSIVDAVLHGK